MRPGVEALLDEAWLTSVWKLCLIRPRLTLVLWRLCVMRLKLMSILWCGDFAQ